MSAEMQMFLFTPFYLIPTWYVINYVGPLVGFAFSCIATVGITITVIIEAKTHEWGPTFGLYEEISLI